MKLFLASTGAMLQKSSRLLRHVITIHETIVGVVMAESCKDYCELLQRTQSQLNREAVRSIR